MNNPFDYRPDKRCEDAFRELLKMIETLKMSHAPSDLNFCRELEEGKMLGVLVAENHDGSLHTLYAFSGQSGDDGFYQPGFVGPVFDYLNPEGHFKTKEQDISRQNIEIQEFEAGTLANLKTSLEAAERKCEEEVKQFREKYRLSRLERQTLRNSGEADDTQLTALIRQSQFEKAELHRLKKRVAARLEPYRAAQKGAQSHLDTMKRKRRADSEALQDWLFSNFRLLNSQGESRSLKEIFANTPTGVPPSGAGECCAPKLLQAAYLKGWKPLSIAEYWYGKPKAGEVRIHGMHYPACRGKCLPVLNWMLQGLSVEPPLDAEKPVAPELEPKIIFENQWFCIVDKPSGMLSVPGKGTTVSVQQWLENRYGAEQSVKVAHRLDQDTSGLLVATFGSLSFKIMQRVFATRRVKKTYIAILDGDYRLKGLAEKGRIELPLSPDWLDRPRQRIDHDSGKEAVTDYEFTGAEDGRSRVLFYPLTGRTHQLRVHAASASGLGMPIAGDRLYGMNVGGHQQRLMLHAAGLEFLFPIDRQKYSFESPLPF